MRGTEPVTAVKYICCKWSHLQDREEVEGAEWGSPVPLEGLPVVVGGQEKIGVERREVGAVEVLGVSGETLVLVVEVLILEGSRPKVPV